MANRLRSIEVRSRKVRIGGCACGPHASFEPWSFLMVVNVLLLVARSGSILLVTSGTTNMTVLEVVRAALPWLGNLITYAPAISTFLPNLLYGTAS